MKEAAGEANMTVITIVLIAIVLGVGALVVSAMMKNSSDKSDKASNGNVDCEYNTQTKKYDCD